MSVRSNYGNALTASNLSQLELKKCTIIESLKQHANSMRHLIYVGSIGSALVGALIMFTFSTGVAIPFMLAAVFLGRTLPVLARIQSYAPQIGLVSMIVIVLFGLVLVTDNFHALSDAIYPYLGLD